jgi:hypothetical protein
MQRATWEMLDGMAAKIGEALGKKAVIDRGGVGVRTRLRIDGHQVYGVSGTKNGCYAAVCVFWEGIQAMKAAKPVVQRKDLKPGTYFTVRGSEPLAAFLFDEGRVTRLWDGSFVDGMIPDDALVNVITREEALTETAKYRAS